MSIHFHKLRISDIRKETDQCVSIALAIPEDLKEVFTYRAGQNITLLHAVGGEELRRSYSVCSSPLEKELRIAVKAVDGGKFSSFANAHLRVGDMISALPPTGKFNTDLDAVKSRSYLAFAAGSGITPIISLAKTILATEPRSNFSLVYGNRDRTSIIFREQLEALKNRFMERFRIFHILSREQMDIPLQQGHIDSEKCAVLGKHWVDYQTIDHFFICGPEAMIFGVRDFLLNQQIPLQKIHFELFHTPGQQPMPVSQLAQPAPANGEDATIQVRMDGSTLQFPLAWYGPSILDAALAAGADLPYACKGGVCATCRARLISGEVSMNQNYALDEAETEAGFILTCQAHPRSKDVVVDFDHR
ncbi:1,2-phenylacetyl-CoA epoxidase subunit PaaE [Flavihumibacter petaseus]|uniref:Phenylacetic acid degradation NADH oxidoreductase n=1 Tax=Flavihumibacter petaseus NBRC 106054 TaxID=1220578 RepID=A0A0E9MW88_9BACT|nr:1,2-phenylacetyl-CoA epoxidase subunit PaaE [Flavihumibacter petaseus]GAO41997.1 phenylacetic acid degradation NADH oxidoreductase [Flavihumibacter petaseus NBRC 106054]